MKIEHEVKLDRTEMSMVIWTCGFTLTENERKVQSSKNE